MLRSLDILIVEGMEVKVACLKEGEDPDSFIKKYGIEEFQKNLAEAQTFFDYKLKYLFNHNDIKTVEGKANIAQEMLASVAKFDDELLKSGYLSRLAKVLNIPEGSLRLELNKKDVPTKKSSEGEGQSQSERPEVTRHAERHILKLMLQDEELIFRTKEDITPSDFQDTKIRDVITKVFELFDQGKKVDGQNFMNIFPDLETQLMISHLVVEDEIVVVDKAKMCKDFVSRIKNDRLKSLRQELMLKIHAAETSGDQEKLEELKMEFNRLVKK